MGVRIDKIKRRFQRRNPFSPDTKRHRVRAHRPIRRVLGHCEVCGGPVREGDATVRLTGDGLVHRGCATYRRDGSHVPASLRARAEKRAA
jgi:hypothetical protein